MGVLDMGDYDVADEWLPAVQGEDASLKNLIDEAEKARPDLVSYDHQIQAQDLTIASYRGGYWPSIGASAKVGETGLNSDFTTTASVGVALSWPIFQGYLTTHQVREQQADLVVLQAQREQLRQQIDANAVTAELSVKAGKASGRRGGEGGRECAAAASPWPRSATSRASATSSSSPTRRRR